MDQDHEGSAEPCASCDQEPDHGEAGERLLQIRQWRNLRESEAHQAADCREKPSGASLASCHSLRFTRLPAGEGLPRELGGYFELLFKETPVEVPH